MTPRSLLAAGVLAAISLSFTGVAAAADDATYQGLGGKKGIKKIVDTLIPLILADARIKDSFQHAKVGHLSMRLEQQFCALSGGPCVYKGKDMTTAHKGMTVTEAQFAALAEDVQAAMTKNGIAAPIQQQLVAKLVPLQPEIVGK
jgi:hemoglobin